MSATQIRIAERRYAEQLRQRKLQIVAGLIGVDLGELTKRDAATRARRLKRLLIISLAVLVLVAGLAVIALEQKNAAEHSALVSRSQALMAEARHQMGASFDLRALILTAEAIETMRQDSTPRTDLICLL
jgi:hypothetical protein